MSIKITELFIKDNEGRLVLTLKLIDGKTRIYIDEKEITSCITVAIELPEDDLPELTNIESINDVIDRYEEREVDEYITPEEAFWVHCSNLQVWVEHDFDTRLLDIGLSFILLKELANKGFPRAKIRLHEEVVKRYRLGNKHVRFFLYDEFTSL